jgi:antagonist of KipI
VILVESPGLQTTVQDLGRPGYGAMGVSASGAADPVALRVGNRLVGNPANAAALEMTLIGGRYRFQKAAVVAVTGAACAGVESWTAFDLPEGGVLEIGPLRSGVRAYLCIGGGIDVPVFLGSASTHLMTGLGGYRGRALRKGDVLPLGPGPTAVPRRAIRRETLARLAPRKTIRVTHGPQVEWFTDVQRAAFVSSPYRVTQEANRMGLRLEGAPLSCPESSHMITEGVALGAVQIPASGQPIILFVEQQTTGGYPKIANVIAADLASVGQLRPGDEIRFEWVSIETARALLREQAQLLAPEELFIP